MPIKLIGLMLRKFLSRCNLFNDMGFIIEEGQHGCSTRFSFCPPPWIVSDCDDAKNSHAFLSTSGEKLQVHTIPEMRDNHYLTTPIGWLFLLNPKMLNASLFNPITGETIVLPPMKEDIDCDASYCLVSGDPHSKSCLVVVGDEEKDTIQYCHLGVTQWTGYELYPADNLKGAALVEKTLYVPNTPYILKVDLSRTNHQPIYDLVEAPGRDGLFPRNGYITYLIESHKQLFQVDFIYEFASDTELARVLIRKWDPFSLVWKEVKSIGDQILFFDGKTSAALLHTQKYGLKGNCIYLLDVEIMHLYVSDLEEEIIMEKNLQYSWKDHRPFSMIYWLMPVDGLV